MCEEAFARLSVAFALFSPRARARALSLSAQAAVAKIAAQKGIDRDTPAGGAVLLNLEHCLAGVNYANMVIETARARRALAVPFATERAAAGSSARAREARDGLLALWSALLPGRAPPSS